MIYFPSQEGCGCPKFFWEQKNIKKKQVNKFFTGLSRDFLGEFVYVFFSPIRNDPKENTATNFCHPPRPGTIPQICLYLCVFFIPSFFWEEFSGKLGRSGKILPGLSGSTTCYCCQGLGIFQEGKTLQENGCSSFAHSWKFPASWRSFTYNCIWELSFAYNWSFFVYKEERFLLTTEAFYLQWASNKHLN